MAYLVYCIMKGAPAGVGPITGVKGREVFFVTGHGLCAAVSEISSVAFAPPVSELLAYGKVVEDLHRLKAVVPMRYGCFLDEVPDILRILKEKKSQYESLLEELEGHVEMGIRILLSEQEGIPPTPLIKGGCRRQGGLPVNGRNYLIRRKAHYRMMDDTSQHHQMLLDRYIHAFSGLYSKYRTETATNNGFIVPQSGNEAVILSLYFLVPLSAVNRFRESFQRVVDDDRDAAHCVCTSKTLLSGPWPPYNFVAPDLAPARESGTVSGPVKKGT